jgi:hypothetical protein
MAMNRKSLLAIVVVIIIIGAIAATVAVSDYFRQEPELIILGFDVAAARENVEQLIKNGPRMTGSDAELLGAQYIINKFEEAGLENTHIEEYPVDMFEVRRAEVSLVGYGPFLRVPNPMSSSITFTHFEDFVLQGYSGSYDWNDFRDDLEVVVIGNGTDPNSYSQAQGSACFIEASESDLGNPEIYRNSVDADVSAIVLQNLRSGEEIDYPPFFKSNQAYEDWEGGFPEIPFFMVSKHVGDTIKDHISDSKLRINFDVYIGSMNVRVAVGEIVGTEKQDELFIIGGHHDTCYNTVGVVDNTVGPSLIIELAANMAKYKPKYTIRFCTFGGEEEGLFGSREYFAAHEDELVGKVKMMANFDMSHTELERTKNFVILPSSNSSAKAMETIRDKVLKSTPELQKYDIVVKYNDNMWAASDHWPFVSHGIDVTNSFGGGSYEYHTYLDDISHLNEESLQIGARIVGSYIINEAL